MSRTIWIAFAALFISHGLSFFFNVLRPWWRGEREAPDQAQSVMMGTYGRVIVMHVTILFGAALVAFFQTPDRGLRAADRAQDRRSMCRRISGRISSGTMGRSGA